jgi:hypothetical protein
VPAHPGSTTTVATGPGPSNTTTTASGGPTTSSTPSTAGVTISVDPNPVVLPATKELNAVVKVSAGSAHANEEVEISSTQLAHDCGGNLLFGAQQSGAFYTATSVRLHLDPTGGVSVTVYGPSCVPGNDAVKAAFLGHPGVSATTTLRVV